MSRHNLWIVLKERYEFFQLWIMVLFMFMLMMLLNNCVCGYISNYGCLTNSFSILVVFSLGGGEDVDAFYIFVIVIHFLHSQ